MNIRPIPPHPLWVAVVVLCHSPLFGQGVSPVPQAVDSFVVEPDQPAVLRWQLPAADRRESRSLKYTIRDYREGEITAGTAAIDTEGVIEIRIELERGFYSLEFEGCEDRTGILAMPVAPATSDPFFAIDGALSWLVPEGEVRRGLVRLLRRSGISMVRERLSWPEIEPRKGQWNWEGSRGYDALRTQLTQAHVPALEVFHNAPRWAGLIEKYPDDLVATSASWKEIGRRWQASWGALEVWNEPDIFFGGDLPADQYVALVKAIAWSLPSANGSFKLVGGVVAHHNPAFLTCAAQNGMLDLVPVASFHTYGRAEQMEQLVGQYRDWLAAHDQAAKPLWLTECGRPWKRGPARPPASEDSISALDITMKAVEARACGVERYFAFVYPYYEERESNFGMMGREGTPLRSMAAYVQCAARLAGKQYLGDLLVDHRAIRRARVFGDQSETIAVLYTGQAETSVEISLGTAVQRVEGIDGRAIPVSAATAGTLVDGLVYVWVDRSQLGDRLQTDTKATVLYQASLQPPRPAIAPSPLVLRYQYDRTVLTAGSNGYTFTSAPSVELPFVVRAFNLSELPVQATLQLSLSHADAVVSPPEPRSVDIPALGHTDIPWSIDPRPGFADDDEITATVAAVSDGGPRVTPLVARLFGEAPFEQVLRRYPRQIRLSISQPQQWIPMIVGHGRLQMKQSEGGAWRMESTFGDGDRWVYPQLKLPSDVNLADWDAVIVRARCGGPAAVRLFLWEGDRGVGYLTGNSMIAADGAWHTAIVPFSSLQLSQANAADPNGRLDADQVKALSIGMNSERKENWLEVSDVVFVKRS